MTNSRDAIEIIRSLAQPRKFNEPAVEEPEDVGKFFSALSLPDIDRAIELAVSYLPDRKGEAEDIARWLAAFTLSDLSVLQSAWLESGSLYPGLLFRGAPDAVRDRIIQIAETDRARLNHALMALA